MQITDIRIHILKSTLSEPFAFSQGWVRQRSATLVEVITDAGIIGWGEAFAQGLEPPEIAATVIDKALRPIVTGADPLDTEVLWHRMYHLTRDYGRKGSVVTAISAVDTALWDIAGKVHEVPIHRLLGGAFRTRVQPYATGFYRIKGQGESKRLAEEAIRHFEAGFSIMKVKLGYGIDDDIACMAEIGRAIQGKPIKLMVDTNHAYGRAEALRLGRELEQYDLRWYEEPVAPEDIAGYVEMRQKLSMPIAGGENEHTMYGFRELLAARAPRFLRRHLCRAAHRRHRSIARRAGESPRLGLGHRPGRVAAASGGAAGRASLALRAGAGPRVRPFLASFPRAADHQADRAGERLGGDSFRAGPRRGSGSVGAGKIPGLTSCAAWRCCDAHAPSADSRAPSASRHSRRGCRRSP